jgi:oxygen-independent coproporphyrinogen-3 oxidase
MIALGDLSQRLAEGGYQAYTYSYPHKTAYRALNPPVYLKDVWDNEDKSSLFLYVHIPFCGMRCGFCNLFTLASPVQDTADQYLQAIARQAAMMAEILGDRSFVRLALGGGTPTYLSPMQLVKLREILFQLLGTQLHAIPSSVEVSPETVTLDHLEVLAEWGIDRISMGVQSFSEDENRSLLRPQSTLDVIHAIEMIRHVGISTLNLDLMYGIPGQTLASWKRTLCAVLDHQPEEIYLYPLYVRDLTGLKKGVARQSEGTGKSVYQDPREELYLEACDYLLSKGYKQISMRMFRAQHAPGEYGRAYSCQEDGMLGLGCGARSYTGSFHYSGKYAVSRKHVRDIIQDYCERDQESFSCAKYGVHLSVEDKKRRYIIQSLLLAEGMDINLYEDRFGVSPMIDIPGLAQLFELDLATHLEGKVSLTVNGLAKSDAIGPWLISPAVRNKMQNFVAQ